jgi:signal transduction histidine kinase
MKTRVHRVERTARIAAQKQRLEELNEEKTSLMGIVAHDLKAPLHKVVGLVQLLPLVGELNDEQKEYVERIRQVTGEGTV